MDFPVEHLSASSITTFLRCPRQWQEKYVFQTRERSNSALVIGSYTHLILAHALKGDQRMLSRAGLDALWQAVMDDAGGESMVNWKESPATSREIAEAHAYHYFEGMGKFLNVVDTEKEILVPIPGIDIPVLGYVDIETPDMIIDVKTTGYFNRRVSLNPEWKLQANIYQIVHQKPAEFHVLTRSKSDPLVTPDSEAHELYVAPPNAEETKRYIAQVYEVMSFYVQKFGEDPWPGNVTHPWAEKYCPVVNCCKGR